MGGHESFLMSRGHNCCNGYFTKDQSFRILFYFIEIPSNSLSISSRMTMGQILDIKLILITTTIVKIILIIIIIIIIIIIKNNIIIIIRTFAECFAPEKFQCKITWLICGRRECCTMCYLQLRESYPSY